MSGEPLWVTVLMPVFNGERYVAAAIESVLAQTHAQFELLILDDGSIDSTPAILAEYAARDPRIRVLRHENMDQPATLNRGLRLARHDWVAIMDHDDVSLPERLERQIGTLREQPEARIVGTWAIEVNSEGQALRLRDRGPRTAEEFRQMDRRGLRVPLIHPSVLLHRPSMLELGGYDPAFGPSADTELWTRAARRYPIVVTPEPLVLYRIHAESMSFRRLFEQRELLRCIMERDEARRRSLPVPTLDQIRASKPPYRPARWLDLQQDVFWYFRSHCLLSFSEGAKARGVAFALGAAVASPIHAVRLVGRFIGERTRALGGREREEARTAYRMVELELSEPLPAIVLEPDQTGLGLIGRWNGELVGFAMLPLPRGATVAPDELRRIVDGEFARPLLTLRVREGMAEGWPADRPFSPPSLSIAICTKDRPERLARLLESLEAIRAGSPFPRPEVLVVDNAPSDGRTADVVGRFRWARYVVERRPGLNFARNAALRASRSGLIAYLDDDVVVDRQWLRGLHRAWEECPGAGGFTGLVLPLALSTRAQIEFELQGGFGRGFERIQHGPASIDNPLHPVGAGVVGAGCNMCFDRLLLLGLGGFDEALDTGTPLPGGGDLDIFYRVLRAGRSIVYEPRAAVFHEHRRTMSQLRRQYWSWGLGFMSFLAKARRTDAGLRPLHRAMLRWWFIHQSVALLRATGRLRMQRSGFVLSELRGALQGVFGEYERSTRRVARIRGQET